MSGKKIVKSIDFIFLFLIFALFSFTSMLGVVSTTSISTLEYF